MRSPCRFRWLVALCRIIVKKMTGGDGCTLPFPCRSATWDRTVNTLYRVMRGIRKAA